MDDEYVNPKTPDTGFNDKKRERERERERERREREKREERERERERKRDRPMNKRGEYMCVGESARVCKDKVSG